MRLVSIGMNTPQTGNCVTGSCACTSKFGPPRWLPLVTHLMCPDLRGQRDLRVAVETSLYRCKCSTWKKVSESSRLVVYDSSKLLQHDGAQMKFNKSAMVSHLLLRCGHGRRRPNFLGLPGSQQGAKSRAARGVPGGL